MKKKFKVNLFGVLYQREYTEAMATDLHFMNFFHYERSSAHKINLKTMLIGVHKTYHRKNEF